MKSGLKLGLLALVLIFALSGAAATAGASPAQQELVEYELPLGCQVVPFPSGSERFPGPLGDLHLALVCSYMQAPATTDLLIYAHGLYPSQLYDQQIGIPIHEEELAIIMSGLEGLLAQGYTVAIPFYSVGGWAVEAAVDNINTMVDYFPIVTGFTPDRVVLIGASEGAMVSTKLMEGYGGGRYDGALAMCGPVGGANYQVQYAGDFFVLFDAFFPSVFPFDLTSVPVNAYLAWETYYVPAIGNAIATDFATTGGYWTRRLFSLTGAAPDYYFWDPMSYIKTAVAVLYHGVWSSGDLVEKAGGQPYDNWPRLKWYVRKMDAVRMDADAAAVAYLNEFYQPVGTLSAPFVTLHTTRDATVPVQHELMYADIVRNAGNSQWLTTLIVPGYGHCAFDPAVFQVVFGYLMRQVEKTSPSADFTAMSMEMQQPLSLEDYGVYEIDASKVNINSLEQVLGK